MKFIPHDYQSYCTEYIKTHPVAALFSGYGLGLRKDRYHIDGHQRPYAGDLRGQQGPDHCAAACGP